MAEIYRLKERNEALSRLKDISRHGPVAFAVHYSCESFYDTVDGRTPRVTSIAIRNLESAQTHSFSIHKTAEQRGIGLVAIPDHYDDLERQMLDEYFAFLRGHPGCKYIHWNMRDINYGFPALEHRFKVLGRDPYILPDADKFDLARGLVAIYSRSYARHEPSGRFLNICRLNKITDKDALTGQEEADAFKNQEYVRLHMSTLRKANMITNLFERTDSGSLQTEARWREVYGVTPSTLMTAIKEHWGYSLLSVLAVLLALVARIKGLI